MNKKNLSLIWRGKNLGKLLLIFGVVFAISGVKNSNAQWVSVRCKKEKTISLRHTHRYTKDTGCSGGTLAGVAIAGCVAGKIWQISSLSDVKVCEEWEVNVSSIVAAMTESNVNTIINKKSSYAWINAIIPNNDKGVFRDKVIGALNTMELVKIYDPNLIHQ